LNLLVEIAPNIVVRSDIDLLVVVLQNLIGNSVKYSSRGAVRVHSDDLEVPFGRQWVLSVSDEGPGIRPSQLGHLFTPFRRGETHGSDGVGLGLAIARQAASALGGHLSVRSEVGIGSTFSLAVPHDARS
jgi:signal transduction histidine kinase